jgi:predicted nucleic acid-binding protein
MACGVEELSGGYAGLLRSALGDYRVATVSARYVLDSMIHDRLADDAVVLRLAQDLVEAGIVVLLTTHIQHDEISRIPDAQRVEQLLQVPVERVPTFGAVFGVSAYGEATYGESDAFESLHRGNPVHTEDALIAATAQYQSATLVTEDRTLTRRAEANAIAVVNWDVFCGHLHELASHPD